MEKKRNHEKCYYHHIDDRKHALKNASLKLKLLENRKTRVIGGSLMYCFFVLLIMTASIPGIYGYMKSVQIVSRGTMRLMTSTAGTEEDRRFMKLALRHAQHAYREKEVPVGAVLVDDKGKIIAAARNQVEELQDATAHAEISCLRKAAKVLNNWRLVNTTLYTTLEPCSLCISAITNFRVNRVVYGAKDIRLGACGSWINFQALNHPIHQIEISSGIVEEESTMLLKNFFQSVRNEKVLYKHAYWSLRGEPS
jgi:tRNA(adenine34) deaminase